MTSHFFLILFLVMIKIVNHPSLANESSNQEEIARAEKYSKIEKDEKLQPTKDRNRDSHKTEKLYKPIPIPENPEQPKMVEPSPPPHLNMSPKRKVICHE